VEYGSNKWIIGREISVSLSQIGTGAAFQLLAVTNERERERVTARFTGLWVNACYISPLLFHTVQAEVRFGLTRIETSFCFSQPVSRNY